MAGIAVDETYGKEPTNTVTALEGPDKNTMW
jgi:hypothetical protein